MMTYIRHRTPPGPLTGRYSHRREHQIPIANFASPSRATLLSNDDVNMLLGPCIYASCCAVVVFLFQWKAASNFQNIRRGESGCQSKSKAFFDPVERLRIFSMQNLKLGDMVEKMMLNYNDVFFLFLLIDIIISIYWYRRKCGRKGVGHLRERQHVKQWRPKWTALLLNSISPWNRKTVEGYQLYIHSFFPRLKMMTDRWHTVSPQREKEKRFDCVLANKKKKR